MKKVIKNNFELIVLLVMLVSFYFLLTNRVNEINKRDDKISSSLNCVYTYTDTNSYKTCDRKSE